MALPAPNLNFSFGKNVELVVKWSAVADCQTKRVSSFLFKNPCDWAELSSAHMKMNSELEHDSNWKEGCILYSEPKCLLQEAASSSIGIYCFGKGKISFISELLERTVIDVTQLRCPQLEELALLCVTTTRVMSAPLVQHTLYLHG
jgi:hypothetical protein